MTVFLELHSLDLLKRDGQDNGFIGRPVHPSINAQWVMSLQVPALIKKFHAGFEDIGGKEMHKCHSFTEQN